MKRLIDVVNFNADASCLPAEEWLRCLGGGIESRFHNWLGYYVRYRKPVVLGLTGATIAELAAFNPEAIKFIDDNPDTFQLVLRPFAHDIALLRTTEGFLLNVEYGCKAIHRTFRHVVPCFLPPEFMLTNEQVDLLARIGVEGVFINKVRFDAVQHSAIPDHPYRLSGIVGPGLRCFPVQGRLTTAYLQAIDTFETESWIDAIRTHPLPTVISWRDGESAFLFPDRLPREEHWLQAEPPDIVRCHMPQDVGGSGLGQGRSYPMHGFGAWMRQFRMLGYIGRVRTVEERLMQLTPEVRHAWLMAINSDILSAIEKPTPHVRWRVSKEAEEYRQREIPRSNRGFEGELYLLLLERQVCGDQVQAEQTLVGRAEYRRWAARMGYLAELDGKAVAVQLAPN